PAVRVHEAGITATLGNCIFWDGGPGELDPGPGQIVVNYCDVQGGIGSLGGAGNFTANPRLEAYGTLLAVSPCIDAGHNALVPAGTPTALRGQPRFVDDPGMPNNGPYPPPIDIGAFEFQGDTCYANCDGSIAAPVLNVADFTCFFQALAAN